jgi:hypothetical protein
MAELADAPDLGSGGKPWGFESLYPHHKINNDVDPKNLGSRFLFARISILLKDERFSSEFQLASCGDLLN